MVRAVCFLSCGYVRVVVVGAGNNVSTAHYFPVVVKDVRFSNLYVRGAPFFFSPSPCVIYLVCLSVTCQVVSFFGLVQVPIVAVGTVIHVSVGVPWWVKYRVVRCPPFYEHRQNGVKVVFFMVVPVRTVGFVVRRHPSGAFLILLCDLCTVVVGTATEQRYPRFVISNDNT